MAISYAVPTQYEFELYYGAAGAVLAATSSLNLTTRNINPEDLFEWERKAVEATRPEAPGSTLMSDGHQGPVNIDFFGAAAGTNAHDTFFDLTERMAQIAYAADYCYVRAGLDNGSALVRYRKYGRPQRGSGRYARRTMYEAVNGIEFSFRATDPAWYQDTALSDTVSIAAGTGNKAITDTGRYRTNRVLIYLTKTGASTPTNPVVSNADGHSITITGTLATVGDSWEIDMLNGTVKKTVSSVVSNDIANMTGRFFGFAPGADTITVTSGGSATFTATLLWLAKMT